MNPLHQIPHVSLDLADKVPEHLRGGLARWVLHGVPPGGFLRAVLANNFVRAVNMADDPTALRPLALFLANEMPAASFGSMDNLARWEERGGLLGRAA